jgi:hypothetical protein
MDVSILLLFALLLVLVRLILAILMSVVKRKNLAVTIIMPALMTIAILNPDAITKM